MRLLGCAESNENVYGCLGAPNCHWLSFCCHSSLLGLFLWAFPSAKCLFIFLSLFISLAFLSCFPSWLGSTYIKAGKPHSCWYPPPWPTSNQAELVGSQPALCYLGGPLGRWPNQSLGSKFLFYKMGWQYVTHGILHGLQQIKYRTQCSASSEE